MMTVTFVRVENIAGKGRNYNLYSSEMGYPKDTSRKNSLIPVTIKCCVFRLLMLLYTTELYKTLHTMYGCGHGQGIECQPCNHKV